jgi:hypothetical protein
VSGSVLPLVAQVGGPVSALAIAGPRLYVGAGPRLIVWDIADPVQPRRLGVSAPLVGVVVSIAVRDQTAYVASRSAQRCTFSTSPAASRG